MAKPDLDKQHQQRDRDLRDLEAWAAMVLGASAWLLLVLLLVYLIRTSN